MITVNIHADAKTQPRVSALGGSAGRKWILVSYGDITLHLPGFDAESASHARKLAEGLCAAAEEIDPAPADAVACRVVG